MLTSEFISNQEFCNRIRERNRSNSRLSDLSNDNQKFHERVSVLESELEQCSSRQSQLLIENQRLRGELAMFESEINQLRIYNQQLSEVNIRLDFFSQHINQENNMLKEQLEECLRQYRNAWAIGFFAAQFPAVEGEEDVGEGELDVGDEEAFEEEDLGFLSGEE